MQDSHPKPPQRLGRILVIAAIPVLLVIASVLFALRERSDSALQRYRAELRARGEKLAWSELGFPRPPITNSTIADLTNAVNRISGAAFSAGDIDFLRFTRPGRVLSLDSSPGLVPLRANASHEIDWQTFQAQLAAVREPLEEIRHILQDPVPYAILSESNFFEGFRPPFVAQRTAAQWLAGDAVGALQRKDLDQAFQDLEALVQLANLYSEDPLLISQMIRTAVSGLGLNVTWHILQSDAATEQQLASAQVSWESIDLMDGFEKALVGERPFSQSVVKWFREHGPDSLARHRSGGSSLPGFIQGLAANALLDLDGNELLLLEHSQRVIESIRKLKQRVAWKNVRDELEAHQRIIESLSKGIARYRYALVLVAVPNTEKAGNTVAYAETWRHMTVTVIALKRFHLRNGSFPPSLAELVPDFLASVPIDIMSGQPLHYRLNADGTFALWSVGEDGIDDGGDPHPVGVVKELNLWSGRDAVWPVPDRGE